MRRHIPSLGALQAFLAAAKHESVTAAANELSLTASAVSRQISLLEDQLGIALFTRVRQRVLLTRAGRVYSAQVAELLDKLERETLEIMAHEGEGRILQIATLPTVGAQWLIPRLTEFNARHPDITVNVCARTRQFLFNETAIDGALYFGLGSWPGAKTDYLFDEILLPVGNQAIADELQGFEVDDIIQQPLLHLVTRPDAWRDWLPAGETPNANIMRGARFEVQSMLIAAACAGQGVALLPRFLIDEHLKSGALVVLSERSVQSRGAYYFAYPEEKSTEPSLTRFRTWLVQHKGGPPDPGATEPLVHIS